MIKEMTDFKTLACDVHQKFEDENDPIATGRRMRDMWIGLGSLGNGQQWELYTEFMVSLYTINRFKPPKIPGKRAFTPSIRKAARSAAHSEPSLGKAGNCEAYSRETTREEGEEGCSSEKLDDNNFIFVTFCLFFCHHFRNKNNKELHR